MEKIQMQIAGQPEMENIVSWVQSPLELLMWAGTEFSWPVIVPEFMERISDPNVNGYVFMSGDIIAGYAEVHGINPGRRHSFLCRIIVNPSLRVQGYGRNMLRTLIDYCTFELQLEEIYLHVFRSNKNALALYEQEGFEIVEGKEYVSEFYRLREEGVRMRYQIPSRSC